MSNIIKKIISLIEKYSNDFTYKFNRKEIDNGKIIAILSYLAPIIPFLCVKNNKFVKFHSIQGMNLFTLYLIYYILKQGITSIFIAPCNFSNECLMLPFWLKIVFSLINIIFYSYILLGIINICNEKARELPFIGKLKIFK